MKISVLRISDVIRSSMRYSMLLNRREDIHQMINTMADEPGLEGIRIFNKKGEIMFSTAHEEERKTVDMQAEACYVCHEKTEPLKSIPSENRTRVFDSPKGYKIMGVINPIPNEPACSNATCHAHSSDQTVLGVLDVKMSLSQLYEHLEESKMEMIKSGAMMTVILAIIAFIFIFLMVQKPVGRLIEGTRQIADGNLGVIIEVSSKSEIGKLAYAFNQMTRDLKKAHDEITLWSQTLEQKVEQKTEELKRVQAHIIHIEKMASLGKLSATVAHEINNPLAGILTYIKLISRYYEKGEIKEDTIISIKKYLNLIQEEIKRLGNIVKNLLIFAKTEGGEFSTEKINSIVEKSLLLMNHHFEISGVKIDKILTAENDSIVCDSAQIQQALIALFVNAVEAMASGGTLGVKTEIQNGSIRLSVSDTGTGIDPENVSKIFDPFFTTKQDGKGVGLGLSVVYGIIQRHNGKIDVQSEINKGTTFTIVLPQKAQERENG
jgi:two-component system NtrC family sensor kinase